MAGTSVREHSLKRNNPIMAKKLIAHYELEVSDANQPLIGVIAQINGWTPDDELSLEQFITEVIVKPLIGNALESVIVQAIDRYFGIAQKETADAVKAAYSGSYQITASLEDL